MSVTSTSELAPETETTEPKNKRKWPLRIGVASAIVVVLLLGVLFGGGWHFSNEVINVDHSPDEYNLSVVAMDDSTVTVAVAETSDKEEEDESLPEDALREGTWGLAWEEGRAVLGDIIASDNETVTRVVEEITYGQLTVGTSARIDRWVYGENPTQAFGLEYEDVTVTGELGDYPAWYIPTDTEIETNSDTDTESATNANSDTWIIAVHGRNASPRETLRAIPTLHDAGMPVLAITYRNDEGAPASPDGYHHLGDTEYRDVDSAIEYALANGANDVVLYGWSMGGAIVTTALQRAENSAAISAVIVDSPVLDWSSTFVYQAELRNVATPIAWAATRLVEWRTDADIDELDQRTYAPDIEVPILAFVDLADMTVHPDASLEFMELLDPSLGTSVTSESGHTASWNENSAAYERALASFLKDLQ